jgi:serine/threonine-protein kinase
MVMTGRVLAGRYRLFDALGEGGMAVVYRAHDELLDRAVAVKVLRPAFAADPEFVGRFRQEARNAASLHHPNIATVFDTGTDDGVDFIVMQLVEGEDLERVLARDGRLALGGAIRIAVDVARALQFGHERGIIHRDVKPGNVLLDRDGDVRVVDFGIARAARDVGVTTAGVMLGSAQYASPEQVAGEPVAASSDTYSLGVVLYEMLTGQRPFDGPTPAAVALERLRVRPAPPSAVAPTLPRSLDPLVMRALERDPDARYGSAGDFAAALESWRAASLGGVRRTGAGARRAAVAAAAGAAEGRVTSPRGNSPVAAVPMGPRAATVAPAPARRRRAPPPALLVPLAALALVVVLGALFSGIPGDRGGVLGTTARPSASDVAVVPPATPSPVETAVPSPATPQPTPAATPAPTARPTPPPTPRPTPTPPRATAPPVQAGLPARDPAETVARFYRLVVAERFDDAAALWTPSMLERYPPDAYIDGRFAPTTRIDLLRNDIVAIDPEAGTATVAVDLVEYRESGPSPRRFTGSWDLVLVDGVWLMNDPDF